MKPSLGWSLLLALTLAGCSSDDLFVVKRGQPIVGGTAATDSFLPAVGALVAYGNMGWGSSVQVLEFCTGTLISDRLVLSAAHCVEAIGNEIPAGIPIGFFTGSNAMASNAASKVLPIKSWKAHPNYGGGTPPAQLSDWHDISILELASPTTITPMKMPRPTETSSLLKFGANLLIAGYGLTDPNNQNSSGAKYYGNTNLEQVGSSEIWVMNGSQKCNGDSGGPTLEETAKGNQDYRVIGVASRAGEGCVYGSVETRVDAHLTWIHSMGDIPCGSGLSPDCDAPPPPPKKQLGESCSDHAECAGTLCIPSSGGGSVCSQLCTPGQASCPSGYGCVPIAGQSDGACVKTVVSQTGTGALGDSCQGGSDCASGLCADGGFCTERCTTEAGCSDETMECVPDSTGELACAPKQQTAGANPGGGSGGCAFGSAPRATALPALLAALALLGLALLRRR